MNKPKGWRGNRFGHSLASKGVKSKMTAQGQMQKLGTHATAFDISNGVLRVTYHNTVVVHANYKNGKITLDTGGWKSATTKARMNQASNQFDLGYQVYQKKGQWFVNVRGGKTIPFDNKDKIQFTVGNMKASGILDATAKLTARKIKLIGKQVEKNAKITAKKIKTLEKDIKRRADEVEKKIDAL